MSIIKDYSKVRKSIFQTEVILKADEGDTKTVFGNPMEYHSGKWQPAEGGGTEEPEEGEIASPEEQAEIDAELEGEINDPEADMQSLISDSGEDMRNDIISQLMETGEIDDDDAEDLVANMSDDEVIEVLGGKDAVISDYGGNDDEVDLGSGSIVTLTDGRSVTVADMGDGTISFVNPETNKLERVKTSDIESIDGEFDDYSEESDEPEYLPAMGGYTDRDIIETDPEVEESADCPDTPKGQRTGKRDGTQGATRSINKSYGQIVSDLKYIRKSMNK